MKSGKGSHYTYCRDIRRSYVDDSDQNDLRKSLLDDNPVETFTSPEITPKENHPRS